MQQVLWVPPFVPRPLPPRAPAPHPLALHPSLPPLPPDVVKFLRMLTFLPLEEIAAIEASMQARLCMANGV